MSQQKQYIIQTKAGNIVTTNKQIAMQIAELEKTKFEEKSIVHCESIDEYFEIIAEHQKKYDGIIAWAKLFPRERNSYNISKPDLKNFKYTDAVPKRTLDFRQNLHKGLSIAQLFSSSYKYKTTLMLDKKRITFEMFFDDINKNYGGIENYSKTCNLSNEQIKDLQLISLELGIELI